MPSRVTSAPALAAVRWATLTLSLVLATGTAHPSLAVGGALLAYAVWRTARPLSDERGATNFAVVTDVALHVAVVASTGWWRSPYVITLLAPIATATHANAVLRRADRRESLALTHLTRLDEANGLLSELHRVAQSLPVSLDLGETVAATAARVRELFQPNAFALLLRDDAGDGWIVAASMGVQLSSAVKTANLPAPLAAAADAVGATLVPDLSEAGPGLGSVTSSGLYTPLRARNKLVGLLAIERVIPTTLSDWDRRLLDGVAEQAALAIDNARWFGRLRRMGADEERTRIARELHDNVGQALAYMSFELSRIGRDAKEEAVADDLRALRDDVRTILGEVRETLSDLRAEVSEDRDLITTVDAFLSRLGRRTPLDVAFEHVGDGRLPLRVEREVWRIAQEALVNAEHHARARHVKVRWSCDGTTGMLEVADDGQGISPAARAKPGSYGLTGMRERADAIGASLAINSAPGKGTTVRCHVEAA
jgi:signal transduction histidine kinase